MQQTAIVIVNYRTPWYLEKCLKSVFEHTQDFHIYLVHNAPDMRSLQVGEKFRRKYPDQLTVFHNEKNLGLTQGVASTYDSAIKHEYICMLNSDVIVTEGWLGKLVGHLQSQADIVQVAADTNQYYPERFKWKLVNYLAGSISTSFARNIQLWRSELNPPNVYSYTQNNKDAQDRGLAEDKFFEYAKFSDFCGGFCNVFPSKYIERRGYILDTNIVHGYWDDNELSIYLKQFGRIGRANDAYVYHFLNASFNKLPDQAQGQKELLKQLNGFYVMHKHEDYLRSSIDQLPKETLIEYARNIPEVSAFLQYLGLKEAGVDLTNYVNSERAKQVGAQLLN